MKRLFEDFVPISDTEALITTGLKLDALDRIERVRYRVMHGRVELGPPLRVLARGTYLRLGGMVGGGLLCSDYGGIYHHGRNVDVSPTGHQPFVFNGSVYYTDDWPRVRIYRDGELFLGHFGEMIQVSNPCFASDGTMYFEARATDHPERADLWEIWGRSPRGELTRVCTGANPAWWNGTLFAGVWNGAHFDYRVVNR